MLRQPLSVCAIVTPLPPGRPGSSRYQGASRVTLVSRKGWPLGRGLLAGVVSPLWLVFFRPAAACVRAPLMGLLSGRAPGLCWSAPPENSPPAKGVFDWSQNLNSAKFHTPPPQTVAELEILRSFAGGAAGCVSVVCALVVGALGLCPPASAFVPLRCRRFLPPPTAPLRVLLGLCAGSVGFVLP